MKSFVITLHKIPTSLEMARSVIESGVKNQWGVQMFLGIDGRYEHLDDYGLKIYKGYKKSFNAFSRPGTVGCLLSHYLLWIRCTELEENICILEHDVIIDKPFPAVSFTDVYKLISGKETKPLRIGKWWNSGAAYCLTPSGAKKLIRFARTEGVMPADVMLNTGIVDIKFDDNQCVRLLPTKISFTRDINLVPK